MLLDFFQCCGFAKALDVAINSDTLTFTSSPSGRGKRRGNVCSGRGKRRGSVSTGRGKRRGSVCSGRGEVLNG